MLNISSFNNGTTKGKVNTYLYNSAVDVFVSEGYTNTTFTKISASSGFSENLISAGFEDKAVLLEELVSYYLDVDAAFDGCNGILEMLVSLIEEIKSGLKNKNRAILLLDMVLNDRDIPDEVKSNLYDMYMSSRFYSLFTCAQSTGVVLQGNPVETVVSFVRSLIYLVKGFNEAGLKMPDNEFFLDILKYDDEDNRTEEPDIVKQQSSVIAAFAPDIQKIFFADLDENSAALYRSGDSDELWLEEAAACGFEEFRKILCDKYIYQEDRDKFLKETNPKNIVSRLTEDPVFYLTFRVIGKDNPVYYQLRVVLDPMYSYGNKILIGCQRLYNMSKEIA